MRFLLNLIILFCFQSIGAFAQKSFLLSGEIRDINDTPISMALIAIEGSKTGCYADDNGKYSLKITSGKHTIVISAYGYKLLKKTIEIQNDKTQNFVLEKLAIDLETVNVYGKSRSQQIREGSFSVNSIEIKQLASSLNNLNTTIGRSSGIKIRENGGVGADFDLSINGLSGNSIRYFIDGVPLSSMGNGVSLANLPVNIVERIEVYKGVVPAELGSDALGGAINIVTKKEVHNYVDASYGIGSFGTHKADFNAQYVHPKTGLFVLPSLGINYSKNNYEMRDVEVLDTTTNSFKKINTKRFHNDYFSAFTQLKIGVNNKKWTEIFSVSTSYFYSDQELQTGSVQTWVYGMATREKKAFNLSGQYQKNEFFIKGLSTNISLSQTWDKKVVVDTTYRQYYWDGYSTSASGNEISGGAKSIRHIERPLTIGRANFNYSINSKHVINFNYVINYLTNNRYDDLDSEFEPSKDIFNKQIIGISYNQKFWNDKLDNTLFLKDFISYLEIGQQDQSWITGSDEVERSSTTSNYGYGVSSRFRFIEQLAVKGSYEHSIRLPLAKEYLGNGTTIDPNFKLEPENSENINLGLFGSFHIASEHHINYEMGLFYRKVEDYIRYVPDQNEGNGQYDNVNNVTVKGIEGELRYDYRNLFQVIANMSYLDERNKTKYQDNGKPEVTYNNHMPNRPWLFGNLEFNFRKNDIFGYKNNQLKLAYFFQYVHWFYLTWEGYGTLSSKSTIPSQYQNNVELTYSLENKKYNISFEAENIFDCTLYDNYMMQKPGRSFFLKLRIFIN